MIMKIPLNISIFSISSMIPLRYQNLHPSSNDILLIPSFINFQQSSDIVKFFHWLSFCFKLPFAISLHCSDR